MTFSIRYPSRPIYLVQIDVAYRYKYTEIKK